MGQTLTHGIYLPDEGERNCYNGLAANWSILDGAVGTIAEHTSALAGKAPLVHTHVKSDITDFPAYGTTAGTICEGNDSRLSDARTPVAHTHTKSDVTDLLNSNFIPSANNSYDLGSSSYQWKSVYAQSYYYNGVAWGLDKINRWSKWQELRLAELEDYTLPSSEVTTDLFSWWGTTNFRGSFGHQYYTNGDEGCRLLLSSKDADNNAHLTAFRYKLNRAGTDSYFYGTGAQNFHLGTSTNKWKTINGINPGALSLPRGYTEEGADKHYINIASTIQTLDGTLYYYTMPDNGWISVRAEQANQVHVTTDNWKFGQSIYSNTVTTLIVSTPFRKGNTVAIKVIATTLEHARFYPMQGNV